MSDHDPSDARSGPDDTPAGGAGDPAGADTAGEAGTAGAAGTAGDEGMSPGVRFAIIVGAILALVLGWWALNRGGDPDTQVTASPSATTTATPSPTATSSATATPTPTPTATPTAAPTTSAPTTPPATTAPTAPPPVAPAPGSLVVATRDGVVVVDGATTTPVPGITGPVALAFADADGAVVVQVDDTAITRVADGTASPIVRLDDFPDRDADGVTLEAAAITLMDVDATTGRMVFTVDYLAGSTPSPDMQTQSIVAATDGSDRMVVSTDELFEGSIEHALGGARRATNLASESSGEVLVFEEDDELALEWDTSYDIVAGTSTILRAPQLDDTGDRMAVTTIDPDDAWGIRVVDTVAGTDEFSRNVARDTITIDLTASSLVTWDGTRSTIVDLASGATQEVTGRATIVR